MSIRPLLLRRLTCTFALSAWALNALSCIPIELGDRHAARVESYLPTPFVDPNAGFIDPQQALGPPDGRTVALGESAHVVLRFFREVVDGPGPDLRVYEIGPDNAEALVAVSQDAERWVEFPNRIVGQVNDLEFEGLDITPIFFVRVRGLDRAGTEPGFDLDALEALH